MRDKLPKCNSGGERGTIALCQDELEDGILDILEGIEYGLAVSEQIDEKQLVKLFRSTFQILHRAADLFSKDSILLEIPLTSSLIIVGNLDGQLSDLLIVLRTNGLPPKTDYLFLGGYLDRENQSRYQIEILLLLLLMKLRWPSHIYLLRGCQEIFDCNYECGFIKLCNDTYGNNSTYSLFSETFDVMPIAAIIADSLLCCHGGLSQWMTSRDNIRQIPRPTYRDRMKMLDRCLMTDILWSTPSKFQRLYANFVSNLKFIAIKQKYSN
ncbi:unnamed protein product [Anisakis simplex]|uniref:protein-serine/threonine phosphatase n=1 Tax=Anisakis simplex TaxID=6269 RepID=A0A0M3KAY6_ANISI|nr:unnamed protein product [Anisakis simplex]